MNTKSKRLPIYAVPQYSLRNLAVLHSCCTSFMRICSYWKTVDIIDGFFRCFPWPTHTFNSVQFPNLYTYLTYSGNYLDCPPMQRKVSLCSFRDASIDLVEQRCILYLTDQLLSGLWTISFWVCVKNLERKFQWSHWHLLRGMFLC